MKKTNDAGRKRLTTKTPEAAPALHERRRAVVFPAAGGWAARAVDGKAHSAFNLEALEAADMASVPEQTMQDFAEAVAEAVAGMLLEIGPTLARLAQADTIHTSENPETVFRRAIMEGDIARGLLPERTRRSEG